MENGLDESVGAIPSPRRGRPRKAIPDGARSGEVQDLRGGDGGQREAADQRSHRLVEFSRLAELAEALSNRGQIVTQIHTKGQGQEWSFWGVGCHVHSHSDVDCVVTTDGKRHMITG